MKVIPRLFAKLLQSFKTFSEYIRLNLERVIFDRKHVRGSLTLLKMHWRIWNQSFEIRKSVFPNFGKSGFSPSLYIIQVPTTPGVGKYLSVPKGLFVFVFSLAFSLLLCVACREFLHVVGFTRKTNKYLFAMLLINIYTNGGQTRKGGETRGIYPFPLSHFSKVFKIIQCV